jgi:hypothetical protein
MRGRQYQRFFELHNLMDAIRIDDFDARQQSNSILNIDVARSMDDMIETFENYESCHTHRTAPRKERKPTMSPF